MNGVAKKHIKRIEEASEGYTIENKSTLQEKIFKYWKEKKLEVSKIENREEIVSKAHNLGNFQEKLTLLRLQEEYYGKVMELDIIKCINKCIQCNTDHKVPPREHPAKALEVKGIFHRIGIDLEFGFPYSPEGYIGILVIVEYRS